MIVTYLRKGAGVELASATGFEPVMAALETAVLPIKLHAHINTGWQNRTAPAHVCTVPKSRVLTLTAGLEPTHPAWLVLH